MWRAATTTPIAPAPSTCSTRYRSPITSPTFTPVIMATSSTSFVPRRYLDRRPRQGRGRAKWFVVVFDAEVRQDATVRYLLENPWRRVELTRRQSERG